MLSLPVSFTAGIVLNAERKSTNSIQVQLFLFSSCVEPEWREVDMGSSVDLLDLKAYWQ